MSKEFEDRNGPDFLKDFAEKSFAVLAYYEEDPSRPYLATKHLWIPKTEGMLDYLVVQRAKAEARLNKEIKRREAAERAKAAAEETEPVSPFGRSFGSQSSKNKQLDEKAAREKLLTRFEADQKQCPSDSHYQVHAYDAPLVLLQATRVREKEDLKVFYEALEAKGAFRPLAGITKDQFDDVIADLKVAHPLFGEVIAFAQKSLRLCLKRGLPQSVPPILLIGPPGLGKTHFAKAFAKALGTAYHELSFASELKSSALLGQDKGWGNASAGIVYEAVLSGSCANPVIVLDEIDKARNYGHYQHPLASLHSLLEPITASAVTDITCGLTFDASLITWICTANSTSAIPETLLSRMHVFRIEPPTEAAVALQLAQVMLTSVHEAMGLEDFEPPPKNVATQIAHLTPREQRQALERAYAAAVDAGRKRLEEFDFAYLDGREGKFGRTDLH